MIIEIFNFLFKLKYQIKYFYISLMDINHQINNVNQNTNFMTPLQMKENLEKVNSVFADYLQSLTENIDENPDNIKSSLNYSSELIQLFNGFCDQFNKINNEIEKNIKNEAVFNSGNNKNNNNITINNTKRGKNIIIDNSVVKDISKGIENTNLKIEEENLLYKKKNEKYQEQINNIVTVFHKEYKDIPEKYKTYSNK